MKKNIVGFFAAVLLMVASVPLSVYAEAESTSESTATDVDKTSEMISDVKIINDSEKPGTYFKVLKDLDFANRDKIEIGMDVYNGQTYWDGTLATDWKNQNNAEIYVLSSIEQIPSDLAKYDLKKVNKITAGDYIYIPGKIKNLNITIRLKDGTKEYISLSEQSENGIWSVYKTKEIMSNYIDDVYVEMGYDSTLISFVLLEDLDLNTGDVFNVKVNVHNSKIASGSKDEVAETESDFKLDEVKENYSYFVERDGKEVEKPTSIKKGEKVIIYGYCNQKSLTENGATIISSTTNAVVELTKKGKGEKLAISFNDGITNLEAINNKADEPTDNKEDKGDSTDKKDETTDNKGESTEKKDETIVMPEEKAVSKNKFEEIKTNKTKLTVESKDGDNLLYAWTFDGSKMTNTDFNIDLNLNVGSSTNQNTVNALIPTTKERPFNLQFSYHGELPAGTSVKVNVNSKFSNGEELTLYYYNEETKKLEEIATNIKVIDGYVELALAHCSEYVLVANNKAPNNAQTSSMNILLYSLLAVISLVGIGYLAFSCKNNSKKTK